MKNTAARILDVSPDEYHSLTQFNVSTAKVLIERSPLHAKTLHGKEPTKVMDFGTVAHTLILGKGKRFEVLDFEDYRTKDAKAARDAVRAEGKVPILGPDYDRADALAERVSVELVKRGIKLDGQSEVALEWEETGGVMCRCMFDHVWLDRGVILDLKITGNAAPSSVERTSEQLGYAIQAAAYRRALAALRPDLAGKIDFLFAFAENDEPFAMNICRPDGVFREIGDRRWERAVRDWQHCTTTNQWPDYGAGINTISAPPWALNREEYAQ
jgi:hypothetical protein